MKKRPQRPSFVENVDLKTGKHEEWGIRHWIGNRLQVVTDCDSNNPFLNFELSELYFLEVVWQCMFSFIVKQRAVWFGL